MYASIDDLYVAYGEANILNLLPNEEDTSPLLKAIEDASAEVDLYLCKRYYTPLKVIPSVVKRWVCEIAVYKRSTEYGDNLSEEKRKRYEGVIKALMNVAEGKIDLPNMSDGSIVISPEGAGVGILLGGGNQKRVFTRNKTSGL